ncbi:glycosyltransferase [Amnibacterium flavum]|nr:glycosyltransferase [Amnibacterium flavum]
MVDPTDLTIIICSRNRPQMLEQALASVLRHSPAECEILVVDSASDGPRTEEVSRAAGVSYVRADRPGLSIARNVGLETSTRPLVLFTDDDCEATPDWIPTLLAHFEDPQVASVTGRMLQEDEAAVVGAPLVVYRSTEQGIDAGHGALMAFRRSEVLLLGGFDPLLGAGRRLSGAEDLDIFCRLLGAGWAIVHDPAIAIRHRHTRIGDEYNALMEGYGRGLGGLALKFVRLEPMVGLRITAIIVRRTVNRLITRVLKGRLRDALADGHMLWGIGEGMVIGRRLPLNGQVFGEPASVPRAGRPPAAEAMRGLDERFITSDVVSAMFRPAVAVRLPGEHLRLPDGSVDLAAIKTEFVSFANGIPRLTQVLKPAPLGLATPAWVAGPPLDVDRHVRLWERRESPDSLDETLLGGYSNGEMDKRYPLWNALVIDLTDGDVIVVLRVHHAITDGVFGIRILTALLAPDPGARTPVKRSGPKAPRGAVRTWGIIFRTWLSEQDGLKGAWREYWRKPLVGRARRTAGRILREPRNRAARRNGAADRLPVRRGRLIEFDNAVFRRTAREMGGSPTELVITLTGFAAASSEAESASVLVPISARGRRDDSAGNQVRLTVVQVPLAGGVAAALVAVRDQLAAAVESTETPTFGADDFDALATFLPFSPRQRFLLGAAAESVSFWPSLNPGERLGVFALSYARRLAFGITSDDTVDIDAVARRFERLRAEIGADL